MNKVFKVLPLALLISGAVHAATDNPWYVGARVGGTTYDNLDGAIKGQNADKDDWGGGVFLGYNFNSWFALEGGYTYLGQADIGSDGFEVQGIDLLGKFTYEVSDSFDIYGKLGGFVFDADNSMSSVNDDKSGLAGTAGVGLEYFFNDALSARAEYQYYNQVGDTQTPGESDIHFYGLSLVYHWGAPAPLPVVEPEPEPMPEPVAPEIVKVEAVGAVLPFAFDSDKLTQRDIELLQPVAQQLVAYPDTQLYVVGHTDSRGSIEYNQKLSEDRAAVVAGYVGNHFGIDESRIVAQGRGELEPVATNDTEEGRAQNRRVEVFVPGFEMEK